MGFGAIDNILIRYAWVVLLNFGSEGAMMMGFSSQDRPTSCSNAFHCRARVHRWLLMPSAESVKLLLLKDVKILTATKRRLVPGQSLAVL